MAKTKTAPPNPFPPMPKVTKGGKGTKKGKGC